MPGYFVAVLTALAALAIAQKPQYPPAFPSNRPTLASSFNYAPSLVPTLMDPTAPDSQEECSGYKASNVQTSSSGVTADLDLAGKGCETYGNDIPNLSLRVEYQTQQRLSVKIYPRYLAPQNQSLYILSGDLTPSPGSGSDWSKGGSNGGVYPSSNTYCSPHGGHGQGHTSDLKFDWSNEPSFQFQIIRRSNGDVLFSTFGSKIVFQDQFLELKTSMVPDYNIYGLAETVRGFRIPNNYNHTFWNAYFLTNDQVPDVNGHTTHPVYYETRYANGTSLSHGVYARNAHGQDWIMAPNSITYRTIGGSFDFYFLSGPKPTDVISQYHTGIVGTPVMQPYWALGFFQLRWGYQNWTNLQTVLDLYKDQSIQIEGIMNDLDYLNLNRDFTNNPGSYDLAVGTEFLDRLHAAGQYYLPILDPNIYVPSPTNASDIYQPYHDGDALQAYLRNGDDGYYIGVVWPGFSVFPDFLVPQGQKFWTEQIQEFHKKIAFDGFWLDVSDAASFCTGSCGTGLTHLNPVHLPIALPGDANTAVAVDYEYPELFAVTNATEAVSASISLASQMIAYPMNTPTPTPTMGRTLPTPGVRNLNFPPYAINNFLAGHSLVKGVISPNATHNDGPYNSTEYELHNLYGHLSGRATYNALVATYDNKRPWYLSRSQFAGSGTFSGHWGGDTNSDFGDMYFGISQALQNSIAGVPYFGVETCGFNDNADLELCTRWMQLSSWFPMYRNHNNRNTIAQEAYRWSTTSEATRIVMNIRYSILPYTYTLFYKANQVGSTVLRALQWEFPDDESLKAVETQFMSGPALLVTPVLAPLARTVRGVFPGVPTTRWYDWFTLQQVQAAPGENKTLSANLTHQPLHVRGGYIIPIQQAANTTRETRKMSWTLLVALDNKNASAGELYLDDGISYKQAATKYITFDFANNVLHTNVKSGTFSDNLPLANLTIAGLNYRPKSVKVTQNGRQQDTKHVKIAYANGAAYITNLQSATQNVWESCLQISLQQ